MFTLRLLVVLGLAYFAQAACRKPTPMENYSQKKFSGKWYGIAYNLLNKVDDELYKSSRCPVLTFEDGEHGRNIWDFHALNGTGEIYFGGRFIVPDPKLGFLRDTTPGLYSNYECTVLCTDYKTYVAAYSCFEVSPDYTTEWIQLHVRNISQYDEVIAKIDLDSCYAGLPVNSARDIMVRPYINCQG